jgi:cell wall-associated NlpC family hydrolase
MKGPVLFVDHLLGTPWVRGKQEPGVGFTCGSVAHWVLTQPAPYGMGFEIPDGERWRFGVQGDDDARVVDLRSAQGHLWDVIGTSKAAAVETGDLVLFRWHGLHVGVVVGGRSVLTAFKSLGVVRRPLHLVPGVFEVLRWAG